MAKPSEIDELIVDGREKGIPGGVAPFRLGDIGANARVQPMSEKGQQRL